MPLILALWMVQCPVTKVVNETNEWNKADQGTLEFNKNRCTKWFKDSPCLKVFIKKSYNNYHLICGKP